MLIYIQHMMHRFVTVSFIAGALLLGASFGHAQGADEDLAARYASDGQQALAHGNYPLAEENFVKLEKLAPGIAEVHATLGAIYFKERKYESAIQQIRTALRLKPALPRLDTLLGLSLSEMSRYTEALPYLEKGFKQSADPDGRRMCGLQLLRAYEGLGRDADAVETALTLNQLYPNNPEVLYHTGRTYGSYAYIIMERLHDKAPGSVWMLQAQGEANESQKNYEAAIDAYKHVLVLDPRRPGVHYRLGRVYLAQFDASQRPDLRDAALREFQAELAIDPENGNARYEIANMEAARGNLTAARTQYQELLQRYPDFEEALVGLGGIHLEEQKGQDAVPLLEHATKLRPDDEVAWYRLAQAQRAAGNREAQEQALAVFKKLHSSTPVTLRRPDQGDEVTPQKLDANAKP